MKTREELAQARQLVIKIGSGVLVRDGVRFDRGTFCRIVELIAGMLESGYQIALVSSGAVALGRGRLRQAKPDRERSLPLLQGLAAVGQTILMQHYDSEFAHYQRTCGQVLLTREDTDDRARYLNSRRTLRTLQQLGVIPIINENDTITTDEIRLGDNDQLAARVACLLDADLLVIFSDVDGFYTGDPNRDPNSQKIDAIEASDPRLDTWVGDTGDQRAGVGTGGMVTKIEAARIASKRGIPTLILSGKSPELLTQALAGDALGSLLLPNSSKQNSRKAWIESLKAHGRLICDSGAIRALTQAGKSLLPSGIIEAEGRFLEGEAVEICDTAGALVARGLSLYSSADVARIAGAHSAQIEEILGYHTADVVIHRDDLVLC